MNYLALLVAAVAAFFIGFLWHGPVFGKLWIKLSGMTDQQLKEAKEQNMAPMMILAFIQQVLTAYVLAQFSLAWGAADAMHALLVAFWAWLLVAVVLLNGVLWEKRSTNLYLFNLAYYLVLFAVVSLIVTLWR